MTTTRAMDWVVLKSKSPLVTIATTDGCGKIRTHEIKTLPTVIGRSDIAEVQVGDPYASRMQCAIAYTGDELVLRDLESTHGTCVNGELTDVCRLREGDEIAFGALTTMTILRIAGDSEFYDAALL